MYSRMESKDDNICYLSINDEALDETRHYTYSESGVALSTGGRVVTLEANAGDQIEIRTAKMEGRYNYINFCAEYIPKM